MPHERRVGGALHGCLGLEIGGQISHVLLGERHGLAVHEDIDTLLGFECRQLRGDIAGVLASETRPRRVYAVAVGAVAGCTGYGLGLAGCRRAFGGSAGDDAETHDGRHQGDRSGHDEGYSPNFWPELYTTH